MPRPQFTLKTMLWVMACAAAFFGGRAIGMREGIRMERRHLAGDVLAEKTRLQKEADEEREEFAEAMRLLPPVTRVREQRAAGRPATTQKSGAQE